MTRRDLARLQALRARLGTDKLARRLRIPQASLRRILSTGRPGKVEKTIRRVLRSKPTAQPKRKPPRAKPKAPTGVPLTARERAEIPLQRALLQAIRERDAAIQRERDAAVRIAELAAQVERLQLERVPPTAPPTPTPPAPPAPIPIRPVPPFTPVEAEEVTPVEFADMLEQARQQKYDTEPVSNVRVENERIVGTDRWGRKLWAQFIIDPNTGRRHARWRDQPALMKRGGYIEPGYDRRLGRHRVFANIKNATRLLHEIERRRVS